MIARRLTAQPDFRARLMRLCNDVLDHPFDGRILFIKQVGEVF